jgi:hypothetical protein
LSFSSNSPWRSTRQGCLEHGGDRQGIGVAAGKPPVRIEPKSAKLVDDMRFGLAIGVDQKYSESLRIGPRIY